MSITEFENFREIVLEDEELQQELRAITDSKEFVARVVELGSANGCRFSSDDVVEAMRLGRQTSIERRV